MGFSFLSLPRVSHEKKKNPQLFFFFFLRKTRKKHKRLNFKLPGCTSSSSTLPVPTSPAAASSPPGCRRPLPRGSTGKKEEKEAFRPFRPWLSTSSLLFSLHFHPHTSSLSGKKKRYVFLLYRQRAALGPSAREPKSRAKFQVKDWAKTHGLECVDATFFSTSADEE